MNEVIVCNVNTDAAIVRAVIAPASHGQHQLRAGSAATIEGAIGKAMGRPGLRFATAGDELEAEIAAFRGRAIAILAKGDDLCSLGIR